MAGSEPSGPFAIELLGDADIEGGLRLSDAAGWNQTAQDWQVFLHHGHCVGCRSPEGELVGTAAALPYSGGLPGGLGWVSMVLVAQAWRHRGLATSLLQRCIDFLRQSGVTPVLDATPAGEQVYRRMGFVAGYGLDRWQGTVAPAPLPGEMAALVREGSLSDLEHVLALDLQANGLHRHFLLDSFARRPDSRIWLGADGQGFVIVRAGRRAAQVGPLVAASTVQALALLTAAFSTLRGAVFLDVLQRCTAVAHWLEARGFTRQRPFVRMALPAAGATSSAGTILPMQAHTSLHGLAGPEFG